MMHLIGILGMVFSLFGQITEEDYITYLEKTYKKFKVEQLKLSSILESSILIDTREREEFEVSHIPNAIHMSYDDFTPEMVSQYSKEDTLILYCSVGYRSSVIADKLLDLGFIHVYNLYGGIFLWANKEREMINSDGEKTNRVHGYNKYWSRYLYNSNIQKIY